jgi:hypothetical protein
VEHQVPEQKHLATQAMRKIVKECQLISSSSVTSGGSVWIRITLMWIQIRLITLMRIPMRIRILIFISCGSGFLFDADADPDPVYQNYADSDPQLCRPLPQILVPNCNLFLEAERLMPVQIVRPV